MTVPASLNLTWKNPPWERRHASEFDVSAATVVFAQ